ncbi:MAG: sigma-70 family RNA polymerase sigma factor [Polyangiaceae bacterium]
MVASVTPARGTSRTAAHTAVVEALPLAEHDDAALLRGLASSHPGAARVVCARYGTLVRSLLRRSLGPGPEIEDRVQDTFLHLFRRAADVRDPGALTSFVVGVAMRVARSELRRRRLRRWLLLTDAGTLPEVAAPHVSPEARQAMAALYEVLDQLDDSSRLAFVLRHVQGMELLDVAAALGCSLATAKRRIDRAGKRVEALARAKPALAPWLRARDEDSGEEAERAR